MDSVNLAVAGIFLLGMGLATFMLVALFFGAVALRHVVVPRLASLAGRAAQEARGWVAPEAPRTAALARVPARTTRR